MRVFKDIGSAESIASNVRLEAFRRHAAATRALILETEVSAYEAGLVRFGMGRHEWRAGYTMASAVACAALAIGVALATIGGVL